MRLIISGAPASGKGTQCERIVEEFHVVHLSTGDMLREAVASGSTLGAAAKGAMAAGGLVPDALVCGIVLERLAQPDCAARGWLLDGFPRSRAQADALLAAGAAPDAFVLLHVPSSELVGRVVGRRLDPETGKIYHVTSKPPPADVAARVVQRADDTPETVQKRLAAYGANLVAVLGAFGASVDGASGALAGGAQGVVAAVDGARAPALVYADVRAAIVARVWATRAAERAPDGTRFTMLAPPMHHPRPPAGGANAPPVVVLVHGLGHYSAHMSATLRALTAGRAHVRALSYDLLGRGHTPLPVPHSGGGALDGAAHVAQLRALLVGLGLGGAPVVLVGHSLGGAVAALYAEAHGGRGGAPLPRAPGGEARGGGEHVVGVALLAPAGLMDATPLVALRIALALAPHAVGRRLRAGHAAAQASAFAEPASDAAVGALRECALQAECAPRYFDAYVGCLRAFPFYGLARTARALGAARGLPVLLLWGERDRTVPLEPCRRRWLHALREGGGACELSSEVVAGAGHALPLEAPDRVHAVLVGWIAERALPHARTGGYAC